MNKKVHERSRADERKARLGRFHSIPTIEPRLAAAIAMDEPPKHLEAKVDQQIARACDELRKQHLARLAGTAQPRPSRAIYGRDEEDDQ